MMGRILKRLNISSSADQQDKEASLLQLLLDDGLQLGGINRETPEQPKMKLHIQ